MTDTKRPVLIARATAGTFSGPFTPERFAAWQQQDAAHMQAEVDAQSRAHDAARLAILTAQLNAAIDGDDEGA